MSIPLRINSTLQITPLIDMQHKDVAKAYRNGLRCHVQYGNRSQPDTSHVNWLKWVVTEWFDGQHDVDARWFVGFFVGEIHGGVLTPEATLRPDVSTLVMLSHQEVILGYRVGRLWFFYEAETDERIFTDDMLIEQLYGWAKDVPSWYDPEGVWNYTVGCLLGELSGQLFPLTQEEQQTWEEERQKVLT